MYDEYLNMTDEELDAEIARIQGEGDGFKTVDEMTDEELDAAIAEASAPAKPKPIETDNHTLDNIGKVGFMHRKEDYANASPMGGVTKSALQAQASGAPVADDDDGSFGSWLSNLWNSVAYNSTGKVTASAINKNTQDLARGTVRGWDGIERRLEDLPDSETDYLVDASGFNGIASYFGRFLGRTVSGWMQSDDSPMKQWDNTIGAKISDPQERHLARVTYARSLAGGVVTQGVEERQAAQAELEGREVATGGDLVAGLVTNGAYMLPYMAFLGRDKGVAAGLVEGSTRANELLSDKLTTDEEGNIRVEAERDKLGTALTKGAARGVIAPAIEMVGGTLATKGISKLAGATIGKVPLLQRVGDGIAESAVGKALTRYANSMNFIGKITGMQGFPEEVIEELEDQVADAALGLDRRESEKVGTSALERGAEAFTDFFKPENLWDLTKSMLLVQAIGGGAGYARNRIASRNIDGVLTNVCGVDRSVLGNYSPEEKQAAYYAWINNLSAEEVEQTFKDGAKAVNEVAARIAERAGSFNFGQQSESADAESGDAAGVPTFTVPSRINEETGASEIAWEDSTDDSGRATRRITDANTGISIDAITDEDGNTTYRVYDNSGEDGKPRRSRSARTEADALAAANDIAATAKVRDAKLAYIDMLREQGGLLSGVEVVTGDSLSDALDALERQYGREAREAVTNGEEFNSGNAKGNPSLHFKLADGREGVLFALDNIRNARELANYANHEAVVHSGLANMFNTPEEKAKFLSRVGEQGLRGLDAEAYQQALAAQMQQRGYTDPKQIYHDPVAVEEMFAWMTERIQSSPSMVDRAVSYVRDLYRKNFNEDLQYNKNEVVTMLGALRERAKSGEGNLQTTYVSDQESKQRGVDAIYAQEDYEREQHEKAEAFKRNAQRPKLGYTMQMPEGEAEAFKRKWKEDPVAAMRDLNEKLKTMPRDEAAIYAQQFIAQMQAEAANAPRQIEDRHNEVPIITPQTQESGRMQQFREKLKTDPAGAIDEFRRACELLGREEDARQLGEFAQLLREAQANAANAPQQVEYKPAATMQNPNYDLQPISERQGEMLLKEMLNGGRAAQGDTSTTPATPTTSTTPTVTTPTVTDAVRAAITKMRDAFAALDGKAGKAAEAEMREALKNGGEMPSAEEIAELAKNLPEKMREAFTQNMETVRKWAKKNATTSSNASKTHGDSLFTAAERVADKWVSERGQTEGEVLDNDGNKIDHELALAIKQGYMIQYLSGVWGQTDSHDSMTLGEYIKAIKRIEALRPFDRDSAGAITDTDLMRFVQELEGSPKATVEQRSWLNQYHGSYSFRPSSVAYHEWLAKSKMQDTPAHYADFVERFKGKEGSGLDKQGNPIDANGDLIVESLGMLDELRDDDFTSPRRSVALPTLPQNVADALGTGKKPVVIKRNIFERNQQKHGDVTPEQSREILSTALYTPQLYGQNQKATRPYNWVVISIPKSEGNNSLVLLEVNDNKDNVEIVHWHYIDNRGLEKIKKQAAREDGQLLMLPSATAKEAGALSGPTNGLTPDSISQSGAKRTPAKPKAPAKPKGKKKAPLVPTKKESEEKKKRLGPNAGLSYEDYGNATGERNEQVGEDFSLESVSGDQIKREEEKRTERAEIARRVAKPLKGGGPVNVQPQFDLGDTYGDLFSPVVRNEDGTSGGGGASAKWRTSGLYTGSGENAEDADINWRRAYAPDAQLRSLADAYGLTNEEARVLFGGATFNLAQSPLMRQTMFPTEASLVNDIPTEPGVANAARGAVNVMRDLTSAGASSKWQALMDGLGRRLWDYMLPMRRAEEWIGRKRGRAVSAEESVHAAAKFAYGRQTYLLGQLRNDVLQPLAKEIADGKLNAPSRRIQGATVLHELLLALHGPAFNRMIAERTDGAKLDGSGRSTKYWNESLRAMGARATDAEIEAALKSGDYAALKFAPGSVGAKAAKAVSLVREMNRRTRDMLVKSGRLSAEQRDVWEKESPFYVPLRFDVDADQNLVETWFYGMPERDGNIPGAKGYGKSETKHAFGHDGISDNPIAFSIQQAETAILRATDNEMRTKLAALVRANPEMGRVIDPSSDAEKWMLPTRNVLGINGKAHKVPDVVGIEEKFENIVAFKENGDLKFIVLGHSPAAGATGRAEANNLPQRDAALIGRAVKKQSLAKVGGILRMVRSLTRTFGILRTSASPEFLVSNFLADNGQAARNLYATYGAKAAAMFERFVPASMGTARRLINHKLGNTKLDRYADEMQRVGGLIGGFATENFRDIEGQIARDVRLFAGDKKAKLVDFLSTIGEKLNGPVELSTRIAAYATCRENGASIAEAAKYAREVTVDFNQKGEWSPVLNALYAFSNASLVDMQRSMGAFLAKKGGRMAIGLFLMGFISSMFGFGQDDPEDERNGVPQWKDTKDYRKQNQMGVRVGGAFFSVPIRGLSRVAYYAGHKAYEAMSGHAGAGEAAVDVAGFLASNAFDPLGDVSKPLQAVTPSVMRPAVELAQNESFSGSQIYRRPSDRRQVRSMMGRHSTPAVWHGIAKALNSLTGGNAVRRGMVDVQPEVLQHYYSWLTGSAGNDVARATNLIAALTTGSAGDMEVRNVPFLRRFASGLDANSGSYAEAMDAFKVDLDEYEKIAPEDPDVRRELERKRPLFRQGGAAKRAREELKDLMNAQKNLMSLEMQSDGDTRKEVHELRMKVQAAFLRKAAATDETPAATAQERKDDADRNRIVSRLLAKSKREKKIEARKREAELRRAAHRNPIVK